jgi:HlyD family secretion protein
MSAALLSRRRLLLAGALLLVLLGLWRGLAGEKVEVRRVERGELRQSVVASGRVRTPQRVELAAQVSGQVREVAVKEGETVRAGQLLVRLDDRELRAAADQGAASLNQSETRLRQLEELVQPVAEQNLQQAEANLTQARQQFERTRQLVAQGFYSPAQLDEAQRALTVAESQAKNSGLQLASNRPRGSEARLARSALAQARASHELARARLAYTRLLAPLAGLVLSRSVEVGDSVQPGKVLLVLAPAAETELTVQIDEKNLGLLALGQSALASADAYPQAQFPAEVSYIAPAVDALRGSVEVRLRVAAPPAYLRHEMTVSIDIRTGHKAETLSVPADCVRDAGGREPWVLLVRDGRTQRQPVQLGLRGGDRVELLQGVGEGEAVLPATASVAVGRRVRPVDLAH